MEETMNEVKTYRLNDQNPEAMNRLCVEVGEEMTQDLENMKSYLPHSKWFPPSCDVRETFISEMDDLIQQLELMLDRA